MVMGLPKLLKSVVYSNQKPQVQHRLQFANTHTANWLWENQAPTMLESFA
jgi:hypothetical protein